MAKQGTTKQTQRSKSLLPATVSAMLIIAFGLLVGPDVFSQGPQALRRPNFAPRGSRALWGRSRQIGPPRAPAETDEANSSLLWRDGGGLEPSLEGSSWIYQPPVPRREVKLHDLVTVLVDEKSTVTSEGEVQRRKNALYDAILNDFVILKGFKAIKPSPQSQGDPRVQGQLNQLFRAEGEMETRQLLQLSISAEVVGIRPNGNLLLEARQRIRVNNEVWEVALSGICRRQDIDGNNILRSEKIHNLQIFKRQRGHVRDSFRRGWFLRILDLLHPF